MAEVDLEIEGKVAVITINRPTARNAVNRAVAEGIAASMEEIEARSDVFVAILTGAGGNFCAGMDLKAFLNGEPVRVGQRGFGGLAQAQIAKPLIAAVEGYALAGGFELALACDMIVASEDARFGLPEVKRGLVANAGGLLRLPRLIARQIATEMILSGELVDARYLERFGLINRLTSPGDTLATARKLAESIAANGPLAIRAARQVLNESQDWATQDMFDLQNEITAPIFKSADAREGAAAFAEKRAPVWRGE